MAKLYISEYAMLNSDQGGRPIQVSEEPAVAEQTPLTISGASGASAAFNAKTKFVRIHTDAICSIVFGATPVATTSSKRMAADQTEYFGVVPGQKVAVISNT